MSKTFNFKKGDKVMIAIEPGSNASRRVNMSLDNINEWTYEGTIVTVSSKYITVDFKHSRNMKFTVSDEYRNKYTYGGADYKLYPTLEDVYNKFKSEKIYSKIRFKFSDLSNNGKYDLKILEDILNLLENN